MLLVSLGLAQEVVLRRLGNDKRTALEDYFHSHPPAVSRIKRIVADHGHLISDETFDLVGELTRCADDLFSDDVAEFVTNLAKELIDFDPGVIEKTNRRRWLHLIVRRSGEVEDVYLKQDWDRIQSLCDNGQFKEALQGLDRLDRYDIPELCHRRGSVLTRLGKDVEAISWYKKGISLAPTAGESWADMAGCHCRLAQYEEALKCASRAVQLSPTDELAWLWLARILRQTNGLQEALKAIDEGVLKLGPNSNLLAEKSSIVANMAMTPKEDDGVIAAADIERLREAVHMLQRAVHLDPTSAPCWHNLGTYHFGIYVSEPCGDNRQHLLRAVDALEKASELDPGEMNNWRQLGVALTLLNDAGLEKPLQQALDIEPGDEIAVILLCRYYLRKNKAEYAFKFANQGLRINPDSRRLLEIRDEANNQRSTR